MFAVDTNVLVYAHREDSPFHAESAKTIRRLAEGPLPWAIPYPCMHEFYSVVTNPKIYKPPSTTDQALDQLAAWMESPNLVLLGERPDHFARLSDMVRSGHVVGAKVHDARIAAICVSNGTEALVSVDRDFSRFPTLRTISPTMFAASD